MVWKGCFFFFQAEDGRRDFCLSRGLGDVYKGQDLHAHKPIHIDDARALFGEIVVHVEPPQVVDLLQERGRQGELDAQELVPHGGAGPIDHDLVEAVLAPGRREDHVAARALVDIHPHRAEPGEGIDVVVHRREGVLRGEARNELEDLRQLILRGQLRAAFADRPHRVPGQGDLAQLADDLKQMLRRDGHDRREAAGNAQIEATFFLRSATLKSVLAG